MNIYIVRHGQTNWNRDKLLQGQLDIELNEIGYKQAEETAILLSDKKFTRMYVSPLSRTSITASKINEYHNLNIIYDDRILERSFGKMEGLKGSEVDVPSFWNLGKNRDENEVETIKDFFKRVYSFLDEITLKYKNTDENILIVTHNGVNIATNCYFNGCNDNTDLLALGIDTCSFKKYSIN